jgi:hypothetical protein
MNQAGMPKHHIPFIKQKLQIIAFSSDGMNVLDKMCVVERLKVFRVNGFMSMGVHSERAATRLNILAGNPYPKEVTLWSCIEVPTIYMVNSLYCLVE